MDVSGDFTLDAPQELAWQALQDPKVLASIMPGGEDFKQIGENEYGGLLNIKVGPVQGKFSGVIKLSDIVAPESYTMQVDGKGAPGFVKATGGLKLTGQEDKTYLVYEGKAQIGGRIASVGQRLLEASTKSIIRQSLEGLNEYLKVRAASQDKVAPLSESQAEAAPTERTQESPTFMPTSQSTIAKNVFLDVLGELIPRQYRPVAIGLLGLVVILILFLILRQ